MSRRTPELEYAFEKHMDEPVKIRLVHDFGDNYAMEFCLLERPDWHEVQTYVRALPGSKPGTGCLYGVWSTHWFEVSDADHAKKILEHYRKKIKTVGDIYHLFIEEGVNDRKADMDAYIKFQSHLDSLPDCVE